MAGTSFGLVSSSMQTISTFRPRRPPLRLTFGSQILWARRAVFPFDASGPVKDRQYPIRIGWVLTCGPPALDWGGSRYRGCSSARCQSHRFGTRLVREDLHRQLL